MSIQILISDAPKLLKSINNHFQGRFLGPQRVVSHFTINHHLRAATRPQAISASLPSLTPLAPDILEFALCQTVSAKQQPSRVTVAKNIYSIHEVYI